MSFELRSYRIQVRSLFGAIAIFAVVFICAKLATADVLTLGYTMTVPVFVILSFLIEDARVENHRSGVVWIETAVSLAAAAGVGYFGYCLWLLGY